MAKVKRFLWALNFMKSWFSQLSLDKFTFLSYQVCHNYPVASWECGASSVVSGPGRVIEFDHCLNSLERKPPIVFWLVSSKISCMNTFIFFSRAIVSLGEASQTKARLCGLCLKSQGQWSASSSLPGPKSTLEAPISQDTKGWFWRTWKLKSVNLSLILD